MATKAATKTPAKKAPARKPAAKAPAAKAPAKAAAKDPAKASPKPAAKAPKPATPATAQHHVEAVATPASTPKAAPPSKLKTAATTLTPDPKSVAMLKEDHKAVSALFKEFKDAAPARKLEIARQTSAMLKVHTAIEEEIFYPAIKARIEPEMVNEAVVEHASCKDLIAQIDGMSGKEELFDAKVTVLSEFIEHHVKEEESEMFRQAKASGIDLDELGDRMEARKAELESDKSFSLTGWLKGLAGR